MRTECRLPLPKYLQQRCELIPAGTARQVGHIYRSTFPKFGNLLEASLRHLADLGLIRPASPDDRDAGLGAGGTPSCALPLDCQSQIVSLLGAAPAPALRATAAPAAADEDFRVFAVVEAGLVDRLVGNQMTTYQRIWNRHAAEFFQRSTGLRSMADRAALLAKLRHIMNGRLARAREAIQQRRRAAVRRLSGPSRRGSALDLGERGQPPANGVEKQSGSDKSVSEPLHVPLADRSSGGALTSLPQSEHSTTAPPSRIALLEDSLSVNTASGLEHVTDSAVRHGSRPTDAPLRARLAAPSYAFPPILCRAIPAAVRTDDHASGTPSNSDEVVDTTPQAHLGPVHSIRRFISTEKQVVNCRLSSHAPAAAQGSPEKDEDAFPGFLLERARAVERATKLLTGGWRLEDLLAVYSAEVVAEASSSNAAAGTHAHAAAEVLNKGSSATIDPATGAVKAEGWAEEGSAFLLGVKQKYLHSETLADGTRGASVANNANGLPQHGLPNSLSTANPEQALADHEPMQMSQHLHHRSPSPPSVNIVQAAAAAAARIPRPLSATTVAGPKGWRRRLSESLEAGEAQTMLDLLSQTEPLPSPPLPQASSPPAAGVPATGRADGWRVARPSPPRSPPARAPRSIRAARRVGSDAPFPASVDVAMPRPPATGVVRSEEELQSGTQDSYPRSKHRSTAKRNGFPLRSEEPERAETLQPTATPSCVSSQPSASCRRQLQRSLESGEISDDQPQQLPLPMPPSPPVRVTVLARDAEHCAVQPSPTRAFAQAPPPRRLGDASCDGVAALPHSTRHGRKPRVEADSKGLLSGATEREEQDDKGPATRWAYVASSSSSKERSVGDCQLPAKLTSASEANEELPGALTSRTVAISLSRHLRRASLF